MSPKLKKLLEKFNLDNYADCENLTLADWHTQFQYRSWIGKEPLDFTATIPELLKCPLRPEGLLKYESDEDPDRILGIEKDSRKDIKWSIREEVTINYGVSDEQLIEEFKQLLKGKRAEIGKIFPEKDTRKWIDFKILQYIDICLIAMSLEDPPAISHEAESPLLKMENVHKHISHQEIVYLLFKEEIEKNKRLIDAQRSRKTCREMVQKIMKPHYLNMLRCHAINRKETRFIKGYDPTWMEYDELTRRRAWFREQKLIEQHFFHDLPEYLDENDA